MLREERKKLLKEEIFKKALELFNEKGFDNVTVEEITTSCGIAKGTFFNYFAKKEHILLHLGESQLELLEQSILNMNPLLDVKTRIEELFLQLLSRFEQQEKLMKYLLVEMVKSSIIVNEEVRSIKKLEDTLCFLIEEAITRGQLVSKWDARIITSTIVAIYFQTLMKWSVLEAEGTNIVLLFQEHYCLIWEGITDEKSS